MTRLLLKIRSFKERATLKLGLNLYNILSAHKFCTRLIMLIKLTTKENAKIN